MRNKSGPNIEPCGTLAVMLTQSDAPLLRQAFVYDHTSSFGTILKEGQ